MRSHRTTYLDALNPEGDFSAPIEIDGLHRPSGWPDGGRESVTPRALAELAGRWSSREAAAFARRAGAADEASVRRQVLLNCAPLCVVAGAWLQWMSSAADADTELTLRVLTRYADDIGAGRASADRGSSYLAVLRRHGLDESAHSASWLPFNEHIADASFRLPAPLLAMSRRPETHRPELLGADLCLRSVGVLPPLMALTPAERDPDLDLGTSRGAVRECVLGAVVATAELFLASAGESEGERFRAGFHWALAELERWTSWLERQLDLTRNPASDMWRLIRSRANQAGEYHADYRLDGKPLKTWFRAVRDRAVDGDPRSFLDALARSPLVRPGEPGRSPLVNGLIGPRGPMFRVFSEQDLAIIRRWIASLDEARADAYRADLHAATAGWYDSTPPRMSRPASSAGENVPVPGSAREAYTPLLRREQSARQRSWAAAYVRRWLARSRYRIDRATNLPPARWDPRVGLRPWLEEQHECNARRFEEDSAVLPSREALIESTVQTAPLTLVDGGWIQGFTDHQHATSATGHFLFATYWDELGNGLIHLNHPRIYREVLAEMGVELPPTGSPEFAAWPGFRDSSFQLPVLWLAISRFPRTFFPEILGLNVAMELSGVGGSYRRARLALKKYGFSTQFVDIHNTIDNVSTGHSAWAVDAVDNYLRGLSGVVDAHAVRKAWARVRVGYRALQPPDSRMAHWYAGTRTRRATEISPPGEMMEQSV